MSSERAKPVISSEAGNALNRTLRMPALSRWIHLVIEDTCPLGYCTTMKIFNLPLLSVLLALTACASREPISPISKSDWVSLDTYSGPFCGRCDTTKIIVHHNGLILIERGNWTLGQRFWRTKRRTVRLDENHVTDFLTYLQSFRPKGSLDLSDPEECDEYMSDVSGMRIKWSDELREDELDAYFGCHRKSVPTFNQDLRASVSNLPISDLEIPEWGWKR